MLLVAVASGYLSTLVVVGGKQPVEPILIAVIVGIALSSLKLVPGACRQGVGNFEKPLVLGVVLLGAALTMKDITELPQALVVLVVTMFTAFWLIRLFARLLRLPDKLGTLLGVGTTICGGTAIAITSPLIEADEAETSYAVGTVAIWGLAALILYPLLASLFSFSQVVFGVWAGTAIHSTPQCVGAGYAYGMEAGQVATTVKLTRNIFMIPLAFAMAFWYARRGVSSVRESAEGTGGQKRVNIARAFPWFLFGYVVMAVLSSRGYFTPKGVAASSTAGKFLILVAMAGIGLNTDLRNMRKLGWRPLVAGFVGSAVVAVVSLLMMKIVGIM